MNRFSEIMAVRLVAIADILEKAGDDVIGARTRIKAARGLLEDGFNLAGGGRYREALRLLAAGERILERIEVWGKADTADICLCRAICYDRLGENRPAKNAWAISYELDANNDLTIEMGLRWGLLEKAA